MHTYHTWKDPLWRSVEEKSSMAPRSSRRASMAQAAYRCDPPLSSSESAASNRDTMPSAAWHTCTHQHSKIRYEYSRLYAR